MAAGSRQRQEKVKDNYQSEDDHNNHGGNLFYGRW